MKLVRRHLESVNSTNSWAKEHAKEFERDALTIVSAEQQFAGKGRLGRSWLSSPGKNLTVTFCFFLDPQQKEIRNISQVASLTIAKVLENFGFNPSLKWPNDILLGSKKVSGILTETFSVEDLLFVAVGIGLNVNMQAEEAELIDRPATSLLIESGSPFEIEAVLEKLQSEFLIDVQTFKNEGFTHFLQDYRKRMTHQLHSKMTLRDSQKDWSGFFMGINSDGTLLVELDNGKQKIFAAGEPII